MGRIVNELDELLGFEVVGHALHALTSLPETFGDIRNGMRLVGDDAQEVPSGRALAHFACQSLAGRPRPPCQFVHIGDEGAVLDEEFWHVDSILSTYW